MPSYIVTNSSSYLSSHLIDRLLKDGHSLYLLDKYPNNSITSFGRGTYQCGSIDNPEDVNAFMKEADACFLMSGSTHSYIPTLLDVEHLYRQAFSIFSSAAENSTPVIFSSSAEVYGDNAMIPLTEYSDPSPISNYGVFLRTIELHARVISIKLNVPTTALRIFNVYGDHTTHVEKKQNVISVFIQNALRNEPLIIDGDGTQCRDFVYIDDAMEYFIAAAKGKVNAARIFNVCSGNAIKIEYLARLIIQLTGSNSNIQFRQNGYKFIHTSQGDASLAREQLGRNCKIDIVQGINNIIRQYETKLSVAN